MTDTPLTPAAEKMNKLIGFQRDRTPDAFFPQWVRNARFWLKQFDGKAVVPSVDDLPPPGFDGQQIVVCGSGPSLRGEDVKDLNTTTLAGATAAPFLDRDVDVVVISDTNPVLRTLLQRVPERPVILPVIAHPIWHERPFGPMFFYKPLVQQSEGSVYSNPINTMLQELFPNVGSHVTQGGCVTNTMIGVAHIWSQRWPIKRVALLGCDYGFPEGGPSRCPLNFGNIDFEPETFTVRSDRFSLDGFSFTITDVYYALTTLLFAAESTFDVVLVGDGRSLLDGFLPRWSVERAAASESSIYPDKESRYESIWAKTREFCEKFEFAVNYILEKVEGKGSPPPQV